MASLEAEMLAFIKRGLDHHNATCPEPALAILLHPGNYELFGWDELLGVPVRPDDSIEPKTFHIDCAGSAANLEEELEAEIAEQQERTIEVDAPDVVPVGPGEPARRFDEPV